MNDPMGAPRFATLLLRVFASEPDFPQIEGDLKEEFHNRVQVSGSQSASRWYRREVLRNLWALSKRPLVIQAFLIAAASLLVYKFTVASFFQWLRLALSSAPRVPGLQLLLMCVFTMMLAAALGLTMSRFVRGRERILRLTFSGLFLLLVISRAWLFEYYDIRFLFFPINSALVLIAFWMGTLWVSRNGLRRQAA